LIPIAVSECRELEQKLQEISDAYNASTKKDETLTWLAKIWVIRRDGSRAEC